MLAALLPALLPALLVFSAPAHASDAEDFDISYCWGSTTPNPSCPVVETILYDDGEIESTVVRYDYLGLVFPDENTGTWRLRKAGTKLRIRWDGGVVYRGLATGDGCFEGTMVAPNGLTGAWRGCPVE
jgi:hypothetical protein